METVTDDTTSEWTRGPADEVAVAHGCYFDLDAAERVRKFFAKFLRHSKGEWAGQPFTLLDWQWEKIIAPLFGWKRPDGSRRFRKGYIEIPKKNGKSTISSGIALYMLAADGEAGAEVYCVAADRMQAGIVYTEAANMVDASPALSARIEQVRSIKRLVYPKERAWMQTLSSDVKTKEGLNIHGLIFDELHAQPNRELWDTLTYGGAARRQPLILSITTAGYDKHSICWEQHEYAANVLAGRIEDDAFFGFIAAADEDDDWTSPDTWRKANPSLGVTIKEAEMAAACLEAKNSPAKENAFRRYRLDQWTSQETRWLPMDKWDANNSPVDAEALAGRTCTAGLDLAKTGDITALVLAFRDTDGAFDVLPFFWIPEERAAEREKRDRVPYSQWEKRGFITFTPGDSTDYRYIRQQIVEAFTEYDVTSMGFDPWNAQHLITELVEEDGIDIEKLRTFPQTLKFFNEPSQYLETLVRSNRIRHGGHPVLRSHAENVHVSTLNGNIRPVKPDHKDGKKIDGIVALIMALGRQIVAGDAGEPGFDVW